MQESKSGKEEKISVANRDMQFMENKRLDSVKRNFAIGIEKFGVSENVQENSPHYKNHVSKN